jgi:hypothetical protein
MTFTESNTVERMILDSVAPKRHGEPLNIHEDLASVSSDLFVKPEEHTKIPCAPHVPFIPWHERNERKNGLKWAVWKTDNESGCRTISPGEKRVKRLAKRSKKHAKDP